MKRTNWIIGAWYYNPMMERSGTTKARYVRIKKADTQLYLSCTSFIFDQYILPNGYHGHDPLSQSNGDYDTEMELVPETILKGILLGLPYGI
jgi:hypothetical protein